MRAESPEMMAAMTRATVPTVAVDAAVAVTVVVDADRLARMANQKCLMTMS
jgi:hypothetical protein